MNTKPVHIHLKPDAKPHATHIPIPVPYHWKVQVKDQLDTDVQKQIIQPVKIGTPVHWCSKMLTTAKKNGTPRRVVDYQKLNNQCLRETHHCPSPFNAASQVPAGTKKTVFDAVDGYHSIPLDEPSQPLTTFITEWGRYVYLRLSQGYLAAGDAYTRRFDEIISNIPQKVKVVDDCLLYDQSIEESFYHAWDFLTVCAENGIVLNVEKFQFCQDSVEFAGLQITKTGILPSQKILTAIQDFPTPTNITDARSWFGLVNQVAWAYSIGPIMEPFRELVKHNSTFHWDSNLDALFENSKKVLISKVAEGIRTFDPKRPTCLQTDRSKQGIGYLLLQKYCSCTLENAPVCCPDGWRLVFAGSRCTQGAETNYSPTEGEALAVAWSLEHAKNYVLGCPNLLVVTDHEPLLGILNDRELNSIQNPRISKFKERTLRYRFTIQHCSGKWHRGPDAVSRNPPLEALCIPPAADDIAHTNTVEHDILAIHENVIQMLTNNIEIAAIRDSQLITLEQIKMAAEGDSAYQNLNNIITTGFPTSRSQLEPQLREYWEVRDRLSSSHGLILMNNRIVIPYSLRKQILNNLHAAHQGQTSMSARANQTVYWPGMNSSIRLHRQTCPSCNEIAPSQPNEPTIQSPPPEWPFQQICADYFEQEGHSYLAAVDRFSCWIELFHFPSSSRSDSLITHLRQLFISYGVPEEISTDGGPQFSSNLFTTFLKNWGVRHRLSSVSYPQSNGRAELAVKTAKRIIMENTIRGSLNNDKAARAILQHRNTPIQDLGLSPAQILFHRQLRDHMPNHPHHYRLHKKWLLQAKAREQKASTFTTGPSASTHSLPPLKVGDPVLIHDPALNHGPKRWTRTGHIVEVLPFHQYRVRMNGSGRTSLRNRKFLKFNHVNDHNSPNVFPSAFTTSPTPDVPNVTTPTTVHPVVNDAVPPTRTPRALQRLQNFNQPGLKE